MIYVTFRITVWVWRGNDVICGGECYEGTAQSRQEHLKH